VHSGQCIDHDQTLCHRKSQQANDGRFMMNIGSTDAAPEYVVGLLESTDDYDLGASREHECLDDDSVSSDVCDSVLRMPMMTSRMSVTRQSVRTRAGL
jgi:hypothetical protein